MCASFAWGKRKQRTDLSLFMMIGAGVIHLNLVRRVVGLWWRRMTGALGLYPSKEPLLPKISPHLFVTSFSRPLHISWAIFLDFSFVHPLRLVIF